MSLITQCPDCGTHFRVVQDQLRVSDGWVRCGHCGNAFDGRSALVDLATGQARLGAAAEDAQAITKVAPPNRPAPQSAASADVEGIKNATNLVAAHGRLEPDLDLNDLNPEAALVQNSAELLPASAPELPAREAGISPSVEANASDGSSLVGAEVGLPVAVQKHESLVEEHAVADVNASRVQASAVSEPGLSAAAGAEPVSASFMRGAGQQEQSIGRGARILLAGAVMVLLLALALQAAYHWRNLLVAQYPQIKPWVMQLCKELGCTISLPQAIDSVVIESSNFNRVRGSQYRLSFGLRNAAAMELALPALELTLTDSQEQVLMRRVLLKEELYPTGLRSLAAGGEWSGQITLQALAGEGAERFAGFRLVAFYP